MAMLSAFSNRQWVIMTFQEQGVVTVVPPIDFKCLVGIISDSGQARIPYGFTASTIQAYAPAGVKDLACYIVMLGYQTVGKSASSIKRYNSELHPAIDYLICYGCCNDNEEW